MANIKQPLEAPLSPGKAPRQNGRRKSKTDPGRLAKLQSLIDSLPEVIYTGYLRKDIVTFVSEGIRQYGYEPEELINKPGAWSGLIHPEDRQRYRAVIYQEVGTGRQLKFRWRYRDAAGEYHLLGNSMQLEWDEAENDILVRGVLTDLSGQYYAERNWRESEEKLRAVIRAAPVSVWAIDKEGYFTVYENSMPNSLGIQPKAMIGKSAFELFKDYPQVLRNIRRGLAGEKFTDIVEINGSSTEVHVAPSFATNGAITGISGIGINITERRRAEEMFQRLAENAPIGLLIVQDGVVKYANQALQDMVGYSEADMQTLRPIQLVPETDRARLFEYLEKAAQGQAQAPIEFPFFNRWGEMRWIMETAAPIKYQGKDAVLSYCIDITERKRAEEESLAAREELNTILDNIDKVFFSIDLVNLKVTHVSAAWEKVYGYPSQAFYDNPLLWKEIAYPADMDVINEAIFRLGFGQPQTLEYRIVRADGEIRWVDMHINSVIDESGRPVRLDGVITDVSGRKRTVEALQVSEERFRTIFEESHLGMGIVGPDLRFQKVNNSLCKMLGYDPEEMVGKTIADITHPEDVEESEESAIAQFQGNKPLAIAEKLYIKKNGEVLWARRSSVIIKDRDGKPAYSVGTVEDITERKRAEEALQASEARLRKIFEVAPVGVTIVDNSTLQWQMVNPKFCQMLGYTEEELLSMRFTDLTHPDDRKRDAEAARMVLEGEVDAVSADKRFIRKDGELIWVSRTASAFPGEDGRPRYAVALIEDITERKRAEEALRESEERFRRIFEESPLGIFIVDSNRRIVEVNKKFCEMVEYSREELEGRSSAEITHPDDIEDDNENLRSAFGGRKASPRKEKRFIKKNGEVIWVVRTGSMLHGTDGRPMYAMAMVEDVTERKRNEEALRESEERFRKIFEDSPLGMVIVDKDRRYLEVNDKFCQMLGYKAEELKGRQADEFTHPDDIERGDRDALLAFGGKVQSVTAEKRYIRKDGEIIWVSRTGSVVRGPDGEPLYGIAMMEDISERKWTEEALRQSEERFRKIFEESPLGMVIVDKDRRYLDVNPKLCEVLGYEREELIGRNSDSFSDPEDVKIGQEQIRRGFDKGYSATFKNEKRFYKKNGETIWVNRVATVIRDADGKPLYGLAMMEDTTERKRIEEELRRVNQQLEEERAAIKKLNQSLEEKVKQRTAELERSYRELQERTQQFLSAKSEALSDGLTGLGNHRALQERVRQEVAKAQQTGGSVGLIMLDIDGFKNINDTLGHQAGDDILRELSQQITAVVPAGDAYRYGGDEFAIIARNVNSKETAKLAEELRKLVETRIQVNGGTATISLGIASFPEDAQSAETLIYGADSAMYAAKSAGKNRVGIWSLTASKS